MSHAADIAITPPASASPRAATLWQAMGYWLGQISAHYGAPEQVLAGACSATELQALRKLIGGLEALARALACEAALREGEHLRRSDPPPPPPQESTTSCRQPENPEPESPEAASASPATTTPTSTPNPDPRDAATWRVASSWRPPMRRPPPRRVLRYKGVALRAFSLDDPLNWPRPAPPPDPTPEPPAVFTGRFSPGPHVRLKRGAAAGDAAGRGPFPPITSGTGRSPDRGHGLAGRLEALLRFARRPDRVVRRLARRFAHRARTDLIGARDRLTRHIAPPPRPIAEWTPVHDARDALAILHATFIEVRGPNPNTS